MVVGVRLSGSRHCDEPPIPINEDHAGIVKPCSREADAYVALRNAVAGWRPKPAVPDAEEEVVQREWLSPSMNVGCNETQESDMEAAIDTDSRMEKVLGVTAALVDMDNVRNGQVTAPLPAQPSVKVHFRFDGLAKNFIGDCPGGGHARVKVTFTVRRRKAAGP